MEAINNEAQEADDLSLIDMLSSVSHTAVPRAIEEIRTAPVLHDKVIDKDQMEASVKEILGIA